MDNIKTVRELIVRLQKCDPDSTVLVYFDDEIADVMEIGGNSHLSKDVRIMTEKDIKRIYG